MANSAPDNTIPPRIDLDGGPTMPVGDGDAVPGRYWHKLDDGRIQCDLCPRYCKLRAGQRGLCFVRASDGDQMLLTTYGRSSGFCIDPIEKKPLNHFYPGTSVLSFGTAGCNLTCKFCQNYDISKARSFDKLQSQASPEMIADAAVKAGCKSVAYTYNDPVIFLEYAVDTALACRDVGVKNVAVTAGFIGEGARVEFYDHMDAANVDLKAFTPEFYKELCTADLEGVKDTLRYIKHETNCWLEITNLIIPGHNDGEAELEEMTQWIMDDLGPEVPVHFSAFHPDWKMMDVPRTPPATLATARDIALRNGIRYAYVGNVHDKDRQSTYCHNCGEVLIGRDWYELSEFTVTTKGNYPGNCGKCGTEIPGCFDGPPGTWGRKRQTLRIQ